MVEPRPLYEHRQTAVFMRVSFAVGAAILFALAAAQPAQQRVLLIAGALLVPLFLAFDGLTIRIVGKELRWAFGVFGFPRGRIALARIAEASATRTTFLDGWGIRLTRRGWLFNVSGCEAVLIRKTDGKTFLLGTDEPHKLVAAIERAKRHP
jgi:hypothetical protein